MTRFFLIVIYLFLGFSSFAQDFNAIRTSMPWSEFSSPNWQGNNELPLCHNGYIGINIDSLKTIGANKIFYHFDILRKTPETTNCPVYKRSPNWTGPKTIIKPTGENIFLNNAGDSIRVRAKAEKNDKWHLCDFSNGDYFEAELTEAGIGVISSLFAYDSIKVIKLTLKDNLGNTKPHDFNGRHIELSKQFGIVKAYDFSRFPLDTAAFILQGFYPKFGVVGNIFAYEIFNYKVGDEFHIEEVNSFPLTSGGSFMKERRIILDKNSSSNNDTITYKIERILIGDTYDWQKNAHNSISSKDTIIEKIILSEYPFLNRWHYQIPTNATNNIFSLNCLQLSEYNNRRMKTSSIALYSDDNSCFNILMDHPNPAPYYIEGLGYYYEGLVPFPGQSYKRPVYFKKGSETWGTPIDFELLLSNSPKKVYQLTSSVSPNPFTDFTVLKIENPNKLNYELLLVDVYGKTAGKYLLDGEELIIRNEGSLKGQYLYKIYNDKEVVSTGKLIVY